MCNKIYDKYRCVHDRHKRACIVERLLSFLSCYNRRTKKDYRQKWSLKMPNSNRRMIKFSDKAQNFKRGLLNSTANRESYKYLE